MELNPPLITEAELQAELAAIVAESIGWLPPGNGAYLHVGAPEAGVRREARGFH